MNFEEFISQEIKSLDETVPSEVAWYPEKSWKRIDFALRGSRSGRAYFHYYIAASVSFILIFSGILGIYNNPQSARDIRTSLMNHLESFGQEENRSQTVGFVRKTPATVSEISQLTYARVTRISDQERPSASSLNRKKNLVFRGPVVTMPRMPLVAIQAENPRLSLSMQVGAGVVGGTLAPSVTFRTAMLLPKTGNIYHTLGASLSGYGFIEKAESGSSELNPAVFLNVEFGRLKGPLHKWGNRSWEIGVGYLVVNKSLLLEDRSVRIYTKLPLTRYLKISPELIFTDKFKSVLPGVTISLG